MGLILSLDNSIHSFNTGKFVLDQYTGAAAAYSLRRLSVNSTNVVRVRRSVDNAEDDFTADEVADGTMLNWVNADMPLPLDTATAAAAYSLRNLKTSYTGSVIRVRRSSDNAEADFTATEITDGTLLAWVGNTASDNGFVTTWYDQAGSNDATQATAANQPKIVDAGVLVEENGKPAVSFDGSDDFLEGLNLTIDSVFSVLVPSTNESINPLMSGATRFLSFSNDDSRYYLTLFNNNTTYTNLSLGSAYYDGSDAYMFMNGNASTDNPQSATRLTAVDEIGRYSTNRFFDKKILELIIYSSDQSSNRTNIETNINDYYNIYAQDRDGFVTTWYDQSGNSNDATQGTAANQPKIVSAGSLITSNGYQVIQYDGTDDNLTTSLTATGTMLMGGSDGSAFYEVDINGSYNLLADASSTDHPLNESIRVIWGSSLTTAQKSAIETAVTYTDWDFSDVTNLTNYWRQRSEITDFPLLDVSNGTNFNNAWRLCTSLTSFPQLDVSSGTDFSETWRQCSSLTSFPLLDVSSGVNFFRAWRLCTSLTSFPLLDVSSGTDFQQTWRQCSSLTSFPLLDVSSGTNFSFAWDNCSSLQTFPANMFDSVTATDFTAAFFSTNLSSQSIENIVVSIDTAGQSNGTLDITGGGNATTATAQTAVDNLRGRGWTVTVPDGY